MPIESAVLRFKPEPLDACPSCGQRPFRSFMRGQVQRRRRFLWVLWRRPYCAVMCEGCKAIVAWEEP